MGNALGNGAVVGVDGFDGSRRALKAAADEAKWSGVLLGIFHTGRSQRPPSEGKSGEQR